METTGYIVQDAEGYVIVGCGETEEAAWADAVQYLEGSGETDIDRDDFLIYEATPALLSKVEAGTADMWSIVNFIACTRDEATA